MKNTEAKNDPTRRQNEAEGTNGRVDSEQRGRFETEM